MIVTGILADVTSYALNYYRENPASVANMKIIADGTVAAKVVSFENTLTIAALASNVEATVGGCNALQVLRIGDILSTDGENVQVAVITSETAINVSAGFTNAITAANTIIAYTKVVPCIVEF
jgi:hypothetical protein